MLLHAFQDAFAAALLDDEAAAAGPPEIARLASQPGFAVYRNTVMTGCIDALQANYPAVVRLVGEAWFRAAAALYVPEHLPVAPMLADYGVDFANFLQGFAPAAELPYLPDVARLDRFWTEAHGAPDAEAVGAGELACLAPDGVFGMILRPHPAARWAWFAESPAYSIWVRSREAEGGDLSDLGWSAEGALLTRPRDAVQWGAIGAPACALLDACAAGKTLGEAAAAALAVEPQVDLARVFAQLLECGVFVRDAQIADATKEAS